ncbi:MAG: hypothetical protein QXT27_01955 [Pyrobaculum sp.]
MQCDVKRRFVKIRRMVTDVILLVTLSMVLSILGLLQGEFILFALALLLLFVSAVYSVAIRVEIARSAKDVELCFSLSQ